MEAKNYKNPRPITLIGKIIKKQNIDLINKICIYKELSDEKKQELLDNFIKVNYYVPSTILDSNKESLQKFFIDKY
tara:strand:- start:26 stop:253 length:228 start_codon:yes stop_codon:yes gene_type:complete